MRVDMKLAAFIGASIGTALALAVVAVLIRAISQASPEWRAT